MPARNEAGAPGEAEAAARPLTPHRVSTAELPAAERFEVWREHLRPVAELHPLDDGDPHGPLDLTSWDLGPFALCQERNPGASFQRSQKRVRFAPADHWYLFLLRGGSNWTMSDGGGADGRLSQGRPPQLGLYSLGEACHGEMRGVEALMLFLPRDSFAVEAAQIDRLNNTLLETPLGRLLADYLLALERQVGGLDQRDLPAVNAATRAMIAACLAPDRGRLREAEIGVAAGLRERARRIVSARLGDRRLSPDSLAKQMGVSRSALYRVFEQQGGVARYILDRRLAAAHRVLCDADETRRVGEIGAAFGFASDQEFSRAFRNRFGYRPSDIRREAGALLAGEYATLAQRLRPGSVSLREFLSRPS